MQHKIATAIKQQQCPDKVVETSYDGKEGSALVAPAPKSAAKLT